MKSSFPENQAQNGSFRYARTPIALALVLALSGCAIRPSMEQDFDGAARTETKQEKPVGFSFNSEVDTGYAESDGFILRKPEDRPVGVLPTAFKKNIQNLTVTESSVYDALQLLAEETGLSLSIEGGARALERYGSVAMYNLSGPIEKVLDKMSSRLGFYWYVDDGMLVVEQERDFVIDMPPALADDNITMVANTFMGFGIKDVQLDHQARTLSFRANRRVVRMVEDYLDKLRATRSMIAYSINIWQVDLSDANQKGVDWNKFGATYAKGSLGIVNAASVSKGVGMVFANNTVSIDGILGYLETQGTVKTVSQPRISILSNTKGKIAIGQSMTYVSKVGTNVSSALSQVTVETQSLQTGLQMVLFGEVHDNTVYTRAHLSLSDLLKMNKFTALGTDLNLPQTSSRELETTTRVKPGDTIVLGGITVNNDTADDTTSFANVLRSRTSSRNELVIAIRPVLVNFRGGKPRDAAPVASAAFPVVPVVTHESVANAELSAPVVPRAAPESVVTKEARPVAPVAKKPLPRPALSETVVSPAVVAKPTVSAAPPVSAKAVKSAELGSADSVVSEPKPAAPAKKVASQDVADQGAPVVAPKVTPSTPKRLNNALSTPPAIDGEVAAFVRADAHEKTSRVSAGTWEFEYDRLGMSGKTVVTRGF